MTEDEMCPNCLTPWKCNGPHILLKKNGFGSVTPTLYRYRDSEAVIKHMDGYTPGEGWEPLYSQAQFDQLQAQLVRQQASYEAECKPMTAEQITRLLDRVRMQWASSPPTYEAAPAFVRAVEAFHGITGDKP